MNNRTKLTRRQIEIIQRIGDGQPDKAIADALGIAYPTVKEHVCCILHRLKARSRAQAVRIYFSAPLRT